MLTIMFLLLEKYQSNLMTTTVKYSFNSLLPNDTIWQHKFGVNIGSGNGLLPEGTKPLPEPMLTYHQ